MRLLTADQMRRMDRWTIDGGHASGESLMERAGTGVADAMTRRYGSLLALRVLVLCGRGNNGGDGFVAARRLQIAGAHPRVVVLGDPERIGDDARTHFDRMRAEGIEAMAVDSDTALHAAVQTHDRWDFALDAMLGTGADGAPRGLFAEGVEVLRALDEAGTRVVAVDLPTGVNADDGSIARRTVRADLTVTFGAPKRGQVLYPARAFVGALEVIDIGLLAPPGLDDECVELATPAAMAALVPLRDPRAHKGSAGRVLVIGGSAGMTGSISLAAHAANRAGAGYVRVAAPKSLTDILAVKLTEEIVLAMPETPGRALAPAAFSALTKYADEANAVVLGPGMSRGTGTMELARRLAAALHPSLVLDADALFAFAGHVPRLRALRAPRVITPHLGEMSRLTGIAPETLEARRIDAAREQAKALDTVVVLKGAPTVTAAPDGRATVNPNGNPGLATLGSGDVLSGVIAALLAQGLAPYDAARLGVWIHGDAGDRCAETIGQHGMAAGDLLNTVPLAMRSLVRMREESGPNGAIADAVRTTDPEPRRARVDSAHRAPRKKK
jgi:ADP-dependent NAD(P)H-hydrate dehydratase / NAD(P)H-hydrate epimerase